MKHYQHYTRQISEFQSTKMNLTRHKKSNLLWKTHIQWLINWVLQTSWTISIWNYSILQRHSHFQQHTPKKYRSVGTRITSCV